MGRGWLLGIVVLFVALAIWYQLAVSNAVVYTSELEDESSIDPALGFLGDMVRTVTDPFNPSDYPARWGGGIRKLNPEARPYFQRLFQAMEAAGFHPKSNHPHADYNSGTYGEGPRALDILDSSWPAGAWMVPTDATIAFYTALGGIAESLGLTWGGRWVNFGGSKNKDGSTKAWVLAWRAVNLGDMLHVEWRAGLAPLAESAPPEGEAA